MRLVEADLERTRTTIRNLWSLVEDPEAFGGDRGTQGRLVLRDLLEGTMQAYRDDWVEVPWHQPAVTRKTRRSGLCVRKRWLTALGLLKNVRTSRRRDKAFTQQMLAPLGHHRDALGQSAVGLIRALGDINLVAGDGGAQGVLEELVRGGPALPVAVRVGVVIDVADRRGAERRQEAGCEHNGEKRALHPYPLSQSRPNGELPGPPGCDDNRHSSGPRAPRTQPSSTRSIPRHAGARQ